MKLEVINLTKTEKDTERGTVTIHKAVLKGDATMKNPANGDVQVIKARLSLEVEGDQSVLDNLILQRIGDTRRISILPVNQTLDNFSVKVEHQGNNELVGLAAEMINAYGLEGAKEMLETAKRLKEERNEPA